VTGNDDDIERRLVGTLPVPKGAYVHAVVHGGIVYCSGQLGVDPETGDLADGVAAQTRRALRNLALVLEGVGSDVARVLQCHVYLRDAAAFAEMDAVYAEVFGDHRPARTTLPGIGFRPGAEVEIDLTAAIGGIRRP
jgi:2-iminobutanoate/2-iminopropanoate deaminase